MHLREPTFECTLPIAKCLDKNMFKELRKRTSTFGCNLLEHIKQDTVEGNRLGWVNLDRGSAHEFAPLLTNMYTQAGLDRATFTRVEDVNVTEQPCEQVTFALALRRNLEQ